MHWYFSAFAVVLRNPRNAASYPPSKRVVLSTCESVVSITSKRNFSHFDPGYKPFLIPRVAPGDVSFISFPAILTRCSIFFSRSLLEALLMIRSRAIPNALRSAACATFDCIKTSPLLSTPAEKFLGNPLRFTHFLNKVQILSTILFL